MTFTPKPEGLIGEHAERIYAGTLGKMIGVYFGRPVEGWTYDAIQSRFGDIDFYVAPAVGAPLIVPDDDISGTFTFFRALEDHQYDPGLPAAAIGSTWLNYIVEDKTVLWWGGLSRSTEHTAFLRLKSGVPAPESGSIALNGQSMAEQIGAQIFIDGWAMACPGDPDRAVALARAAASVSHDALAVDAACLLAAMESLAFEENNLLDLIDAGRSYVSDPRLLSLVDDVVDVCSNHDDWRDVRSWIAANHDYDRYPGNCPMATNHAAVIMALLMAGDDFQRSVSIATSAGWDTDCNAGNVGCLNGIRLGLEGIEKGADLRSPIGDRAYVVSADGGECLSDAVREARKIIAAGAALRGEARPAVAPRFRFEYPGSTQGWSLHPAAGIEQALSGVGNGLDSGKQSGLVLPYANLARGVKGVASVNTFIDPAPTGEDGTSYFEVIASPSLYPTQIITATVLSDQKQGPLLAFFVDYYEHEGHISTITGEPQQLQEGINTLTWDVPDTGGLPIYRLGVELSSTHRVDGNVTIVDLDWFGAPQRLSMGRAMDLSPDLTPWTTETIWLRSFVSSAKAFAPDYTTTFSISHPEPNGVATTGTRDWQNYGVSSRLTFSQQDRAGLVARARGHRRYYAATLSGGAAQIIKRRDDDVVVLGETPYDYHIDSTYELELRVVDGHLQMSIDGAPVVEAHDEEYESGGAGFLVDSGAILADGFQVTSEEKIKV